MTFLLHRDPTALQGHIHLDGSKSISNRALTIRALSGQDFPLENLSTSQDTQTMVQLLQQKEGELDVGPAGTTFRFLTAYLAIQPGAQILTGSARMKQRPIGPLVDALRRLGADIVYLDREGYPPLKIGTPARMGEINTLTIPADISSQFISALVMIAPCLPKGLTIELEGDLVSASYLKMTLAMLDQFGVQSDFENGKISIASQSYLGRPYTVESDWSAASYHFALAALASDVDLTLAGLMPDSMQGDAVIPSLFSRLGVDHSWHGTDLHLSKGAHCTQAFEHDFLLCPDIAQTLAVVLAGKGVAGLFSGLQTLSIKETDRILALRTELAKVGVSFAKMPSRFSKRTEKEYHMVEGKAGWHEPPVFATYHDHRMAMAFAPLAMMAPIKIEDPGVVGKSYPDFWKHLTDLEFVIELQKEIHPS